MPNANLPLNDPHRRIAAVYNLAAVGYDRPALRFFYLVAQHLVELAQPKPGDRVLDAATGTGAALLAVAPQVGPRGKVTGMDLAVDMLAQAHNNLSAVVSASVELVAGDIAHLDFANDTFDLVLCSSGIFWLTDMVAGLQEWRRVLKPGGTVAFSSYGASTFQPLADLLESALRRYGVSLPTVCPFAWQRLTDLEQSSDLLRAATFSAIDVRGEQLGYYLADSDEWWDILWHSGFQGPLAQLTPDGLARFKTEHLAAVAALATARGIWLNVAAIFAVGQKK